jgi:hypothetical protein
MDEPQPTEPKSPPAPKRDMGLLLVLALGLLAGLGACFFVHSHAENGAELAAKFGAELSGLAQIYANAAPFAFIFPPVVCLMALAITRLGRTQLSSGKMLVAVLFGFALLWPAGAFLAFQKAYDPPRSTPTRMR